MFCSLEALKCVILGSTATAYECGGLKGSHPQKAWMEKSECASIYRVYETRALPDYYKHSEYEKEQVFL
jgi:hypothetical protein